MSYRLEKFTRAIEDLIGLGSIQERLYRAFTYNLLQLHQDDFPEEHLRQRFENLTDSLTCREAIGDEGTAWATISVMTDEECLTYAQRIFNLFLEFSERDN